MKFRNILGKFKSSCSSKCKVTPVYFAKSVAVVALSFGVSTAVMFSPLGEKAMRRYINKYPRDIISSFQEMERKEKGTAEQEARLAAEPIFRELRSSKDTFVLGDRNASHAIVLFYDYACGYCSRQAKDLEEALKQRSDTVVILQDFPILSMNSLMAAKASLFIAKNHPKQFQSFFYALFKEKTKDEASIKKLAASFGIPAKGVEKAMSSNEYDAILRDNYSRASKMKLSGTPALIVDGKLYVGALDASQIVNAIDGKDVQ